MNRVVAAICSLVLCAAAHAQQYGLVLINPDAAGPHADLRTYTHPTWIYWPHNDASGVNRLRSLVSGLDWHGSVQDLSFRPAGAGAWCSNAYSSLIRNGYLLAREHYLGSLPVYAVSRARSEIPVESLFLALGSGSDTVRPIAWKGQSRGLSVYVARDWNECAEFVAIRQCRTVVIEYPAPNGAQWSRFWLFGPGWPAGVPTDPGVRVPGLVAGSQVVDLLATPARFDWATPKPSWPGANRWLESVRFVGPWILGVVGLAIAAVAAWSTSRVAKEARSGWAAAALLSVALAPAAIVLGGEVCRWTDVSYLLEAFVASWLLLSAAALAASVRLRTSGKIAVVAWLSAVVLFFCDPRWSPTSSVFGWRQEAVPALPLGCLLCSLLVALIAGPKWPARSLFAVYLGWAILGDPWWARDPLLLWALPLVWLAGERWLRPPAVLFPLAVLLPRVVVEGVSWMPDGLLSRYEELHALNHADIAHALVSPIVGACAVFALGMAVFGDRFLVHQARRVIRYDPRRRAPFEAALALAVVGLVDPPLLTVAVMLLIAGFLMLLYAGVTEL